MSWFKNLKFYQFNTPWLAPEDLEDQLRTKACADVAPGQVSSLGWASPFYPRDAVLGHIANDCIRICLEKRERIVPIDVLNQRTCLEVARIEAEGARQVGRKERMGIKDEILLDMLKQSFVRSSFTYAYIDLSSQMVVVNTTVNARAEELLALMRETLGTFPVFPLSSGAKDSAEGKMTEWALNPEKELPETFELSFECELASVDGEKISGRGIDLTEATIHSVIDNGRTVKRLGICFEDRMSFVLTHDFDIRKVKFLECVEVDRSEIETDDFESAADADFTIMTAEISELYETLLEIFAIPRVNE